jgi:hypothetical protein
MLHTGELRFAKELREAPTLQDELKDFRRHVSEAGRYSFSARDGKHDDLVLAVAIALWRAVKRKKTFGSPSTPPRVHLGHEKSKATCFCDREGRAKQPRKHISVSCRLTANGSATGAFCGHSICPHKCSLRGQADMALASQMSAFLPKADLPSCTAHMRFRG